MFLIKIAIRQNMLYTILQKFFNIPKGKPVSVNQRRTDNTMAKKKTKGQAMI